MGTLGALFTASLSLCLEVSHLRLSRALAFFGAAALAGQRRAEAPRRVLLHMKQIGRRMSAQMHFRIVDDRFGLIADHLAHGNGQGGKFRAQTPIPGVRIPPRLILFQQDEVGHGFYPHQTDVGMKRLVDGHANFPRWHPSGQALIFLLANTISRDSHLLGDSLLSAVGRGDEFVEATEFQERTQVANAAVVGLHKDQMGRP